MNKYYIKNKTKQLSAQKLRYQNRTPEQQQAYIEYQRQWRAKRTPEQLQQARHKSLERYYKDRERLKPLMRERFRTRHLNDPRLAMYQGAKYRARIKNIPFTITLEDLIIPEYCPVLGIKLKVGLSPNSPELPSLDRVFPELGYTKENICIISNRANSLKRDGVLEEFTKLVNWMKKRATK